LIIQVNKYRPFASPLQTCSDIRRRRGLAAATFAQGYTNFFCHTENFLAENIRSV